MQILIAGLAKSGTTGLLYLLKNSLQPVPTLLFEPRQFSADVLTTTPDLVAKIIIDHRVETKEFGAFKQKITLVRDPRDRLVSDLLYRQYHAEHLADDAKVSRVLECLRRKEDNPASVSISEILETIGSVSGEANPVGSFMNYMASTLKSFDRYCASMPDALLYKYEDFVDKNYLPIERFLGCSIAGEAVVPETFKRVERTKGHGDWRNWFTAADVDLVRPTMGPWLRKYGYDDDDWRVSDAPSIEAAHCSEYFARLVHEARLKARKTPASTAAAQKVADAGRQAEADAPRQLRPTCNVGTVLRAEPGLVTGWAIGDSLDDPVRVELLVNGQAVRQVLADAPRPMLAQRGLHPTGRCGFAFRFDQSSLLQVGDHVSVRPIDGGFQMRNSPLAVTPPVPIGTIAGN